MYNGQMRVIAYDYSVGAMMQGWQNMSFGTFSIQQQMLTFIFSTRCSVLIYAWVAVPTSGYALKRLSTEQLSHFSYYLQ